MSIDGNIIPLFAISVGLIITVTKTLSGTISKHKLEVEKIRADALVRAEEVRSKNELELERLMRQDQGSNNTYNANANNSYASANYTPNTNTSGANVINDQPYPETERKSTRERIRD